MSERHVILVLGQKKAGTTSLYSAIAATGLPLIDIPKESGVMNSSAMLQRVLAQAPDGAVLLDATTTYFESGGFSDEFLRNVRIFDKVTILFVVREEAERLASHFQHSLNHDGWTGNIAEFVASNQYLNHARLTPIVDALQVQGINNIRMIRFALLNDTESLARAITCIVGLRPDFGEAIAKNTFGSMVVLPRLVQRFLGTPLFQLVLRPLLPDRLRLVLKQLLGRKARAAAVDTLNHPEIQTVADQIDAENRALLAHFIVDGTFR